LQCSSIIKKVTIDAAFKRILVGITQVQLETNVADDVVHVGVKVHIEGLVRAPAVAVEHRHDQLHRDTFDVQDILFDPRVVWFYLAVEKKKHTLSLTL